MMLINTEAKPLSQDHVEANHPPTGKADPIFNIYNASSSRRSEVPWIITSTKLAGGKSRNISV
jgi:hypothetical protein